jgi:F-type H+-transporting ATPase subunit beta
MTLAKFRLGAFYMVGDFESARAKGEKILAELEDK